MGQNEARSGARPGLPFDAESAWMLCDAAPDGMLVVDRGGVILLANRQAGAMFGYDPADLVGLRVDELVPQRLRDRHVEHRSSYAADPQTRPMGSDLRLFGARRDGSEFPVEISLSPLHSEAEPLVIAAVRDVTERHEAESRHQLIRHAMEATHDGVFMFDPQSLVLDYVNEGAIDLIGRSRDELLGRATMFDFTPEFSRRSLETLLGPLVAGDVDAQRFSTLLRRVDGVDVPVDVVLEYPRPAHHGAERPLVAIVRDISDRIAMQTERNRIALLEDRERIGADLHDMVIQRLFATGMRLQAVASLAGEPAATRIEEAVGELDETIADIRTTIFRLHRSEPNTPVQEVLRLTVLDKERNLGFAPRLELEGDLESLPPPVVEHLTATMNEALSNVVRHAGATAVEVRVSVDASTVSLCIADDGRGLAEDAHRGNGITNMSWRAAGLGGSCEIGPSDPRGTRVVWTVPVGRNLPPVD